MPPSSHCPALRRWQTDVIGPPSLPIDVAHARRGPIKAELRKLPRFALGPRSGRATIGVGAADARIRRIAEVLDGLTLRPPRSPGRSARSTPSLAPTDSKQGIAMLL